MTAPRRRPYRKRKRARSEQETRLRITEAAVDLHGTVGPAATTVAEVARRAGVSRMTVYNHFPEEKDLFRACSSHWARMHPMPDPEAWTGADPQERLRNALGALYGWYARNHEMLGRVFSDVPKIAALGEVVDELWGGYFADVVQGLALGWPGCAGEPAIETVAAVRLAVAFDTWRTLDGAGLDPGAAAALVTRMVEGAAVSASGAA